jgi:hypothetical protein
MRPLLLCKYLPRLIRGANLVSLSSARHCREQQTGMQVLNGGINHTDCLSRLLSVSRRTKWKKAANEVDGMTADTAQQQIW